MIRVVRALAWMRWRILINTLKGAGRRDAWERLSRIGAVVTPILVALMVIPASLALGTAAFVGGWFMPGSETTRRAVIITARALLAIITIVVAAAPLIRSMQGSEVNVTRLLLLPIRRRVLHLSEVVSGLTDPWVAALIPALLLLPLGLLAAGSLVPAVLALLAGLAFLATTAVLGSLSASLAMLLFRNRRRAEMMTLTLVTFLVLLGFVPALVDRFVGGGDEQEVEERLEEHAAAEPVSKPDPQRLFVWASLFPSELYGKALARVVEGRAGAGALHLAGLGGIGVALYALSAWTHRRLVENPETGGRRRSGQPARVWSPRIPGLSRTTSAVALAQVRSVLRTVRGKTAVYFTFGLVALIYLVLAHRIDDLIEGTHTVLGGTQVAIGPLLLLIGVAFTLMSLQPVIVNQFAIDGDGLALLFLAPISDRELIKGKLTGCGLLGLVSVLLCLLAAIALARDGHVLYWCSVPLVGVSAYLLLCPLCALLSALLPKKSDLSRLGKAGNPHPTAGFVGFAITMLALMPPLVLLSGSVWLGVEPAVTLGLLVGWSVITGALSILLVRLASAALARRRENLLLVASGR